MKSEEKLRNSFSRIKIDIDSLKHSINDIKQNISQIRENQNYLFSEIDKNKRENSYEIKYLKDRIELLERKLFLEK